MNGIVYMLYDISTDCYKIGITGSLTINKRKKQLQTGNSEELFVKYTFSSKYYKKIEKTLHNLYSHKRIKGEWFSFEKKDIDEFIKTCKKIEQNFIFIEKNNLNV